MDIYMGITLCVAIFLYFSLDLMFAEYESVADEKFQEHLQKCKVDKHYLSNSEKETLKFMEATFASKSAKWLIVLYLFITILSRLFTFTFLKPTKESNVLDKEHFAMTIYYWGHSHLYRNGFTAIISYILFSILNLMHFMNKTLWVENMDKPAKIESADIYISSKKIMRRHECLA